MFVFRLCVHTYTYLTLPVYYVLQKPYKTLQLCQYQRAVQLNPNDPYSPWIRCQETRFHPLTTSESVGDAMQLMRRLYPLDRQCVGYRTVIAETVCRDSSGQAMRLDGKVLRKVRLSPYVWMTYREVFDTVDCVSKALVANGVVRGDKIVCLTETCVDTLIFYQVAIKIGAVIVTVFATLGEDGISHCINETNASYIYTTYDLLPTVGKLLENCRKLSTVIYVDNNSQTINTNNKTQFASHIKLWPISRLQAQGLHLTMDLSTWLLDPDQLQIISYTSGTTGQPKGIQMTSKQMVSAGISASAVMEKFMDEPEKHIYIAYLPQSHSLELSIELYAFMGGCPIGFATPFTLNDSAPGLAPGETCDLKLLKPTIMVTVPLVLDRMRKEIYHKLRARTPVSAPIFTFLMKYKSYWTAKGYDCPIVNSLVCPKVRVQFGDRLEHMVVGGAALSPDLQRMIKSALDITLVQGYGTTETFGAVLCMDDRDLSWDRCGAPLKDVLVRLDDWPEGGYTASDQPNPRGELIVGSRGVAIGYFNNPKLTTESFIDDLNDSSVRWFRTGDIGEVFADGTVKIIDRKKDLIKLSNGEYFSLGKIESCLKNCTLVDNICIVGKAYRDYLIALVIPNQKSLQQLAQHLKLSHLSDVDLCTNSAIVDAVHRDIIESGREYKLNKREIPVKIMICSEEWTPDNGMLTAAMKLKRLKITTRYAKDIETMFGVL
ncbi:long-chain-fatty-acid--CoA ligase 4-like [Oppia nitens]|uniref:long-chain-fatty-acid--CoA ligase 4-like n=1 Tax=Oppia nitens TaxID=1686743 RepID=UPI0023DBA0A3|nr:long-chain-fatty-acid--CoA ligase 4-like [Oppia nitens]